MRTELAIRCDYGSIEPWLQPAEGGLAAVAGPDAVRLWAGIPVQHARCTAEAPFVVRAGQRESFVLTWHPSRETAPPQIDPDAAVRATTEWWQAWAGQCTYRGPYRAQVLRSLLTLKALTYHPTGGIVAAPTTSLPERLRRGRDTRVT